MCIRSSPMYSQGIHYMAMFNKGYKFNRNLEISFLTSYLWVNRQKHTNHYTNIHLTSTLNESCHTKHQYFPSAFQHPMHNATVYKSLKCLICICSRSACWPFSWSGQLTITITLACLVTLAFPQPRSMTLNGQYNFFNPIKEAFMIK